MNPRSNRADELGSIFVAVTGTDAVTEPQRSDPSDRELPPNTTVTVVDGLDEAVAGAEVDEPTDPAS